MSDVENVENVENDSIFKRFIGHIKSHPGWFIVIVFFFVVDICLFCAISHSISSMQEGTIVVSEGIDPQVLDLSDELAVDEYEISVE